MRVCVCVCVKVKYHVRLQPVLIRCGCVTNNGGMIMLRVEVTDTTPWRTADGFVVLSANRQMHGPAHRNFIITQVHGRDD